MTDYTVVAADSAEELSAKVVELLLFNWVPHGSVVVIVRGAVHLKYFQAMVRA
jgi:hypothetical protein